MTDRDPKCVLVVADSSAAAALAAWLTEKGFPAEVVVPSRIASTGDALGMTEASPAGLEVRVLSPDHADSARTAIEEQRAEVAEVAARKDRRAARTGTVTAVCEECGKPSEWPAAEMGTTQDCPHCGSYLDVPDPDENWDDVEFGSEADETADGGPEHAS